MHINRILNLQTSDWRFLILLCLSGKCRSDIDIKLVINYKKRKAFIFYNKVISKVCRYNRYRGLIFCLSQNTVACGLKRQLICNFVRFYKPKWIKIMRQMFKKLIFFVDWVKELIRWFIQVTTLVSGNYQIIINYHFPKFNAQ